LPAHLQIYATEPTGVVFDIMRFCIHDGPGIRTIVFLKGCPLNCWWCHNPEGISPRPEMFVRPGRCIGCGRCMQVCSVGLDRSRCTFCGECVRACHTGAREIVGQTMTVAQVMEQIEKDIIFYDESGGGVTFSGGEPLMQPEFLEAVLKACKTMEIHTAVETSGYAKPETIKRIAQYVDLFLYDIKSMDDEKHKEATGVSNKLILSNIRDLSEWHPNVEIRFPVIPGVNDDIENVKALADLASSLKVKGVHLLRYHNAGTEKYGSLDKTYFLTDLQPPTDEKMAEIRSVFEDANVKVLNGGNEYYEQKSGAA